MSEVSVNRKTITRPEKVDVFLFVAWTIKELSCDAQSKFGTVITDKDNRIIATGYNSFPRKVDNESLPNLRPDKYPWMYHSERNALANLTTLPKQIGGARAYVTGPCCFPCVCALWQHGVDEIYYVENGVKAVCVEDGSDAFFIQELLDRLDGKLSYTGVTPNFEFMKTPWANLKQKGFLHTEFEDMLNRVKEM